MPSIAEAMLPSPASGKKRRREVGAELQMKLSCSPAHSKLHAAAPRDDIYLGDHHSPRNLPSPRRRLHDPKRPRLGAGLSNLEGGSAGRDVSRAQDAKPPGTDRSGRYTQTPRAAVGSGAASGRIDLSPCHICRRKPTVKSEMDAFGPCELCGERTCYICTRRCEGPGEAGEDMVLEHQQERGLARHGDHRAQICSSCCVEKGAEGEVWCLGCLRKGG